jgi:hypothetical protein
MPPLLSPLAAHHSWKSFQEALLAYLRAGALFATSPVAEQIHLGTVVREATTAYEVYLTDALGELFGAYGHTFREFGLAAWPSWAELKRQYLKCMECEIESESVARIRTLRHVLTHRFGRVETEEERLLFASMLRRESFGNDRIWLKTSVVEEMLGELDERVAVVQAMITHFSASPGRSRVLSLS